MTYIEKAKALSDAIFHSVYGVERQRDSAIDILAQNASTQKLEAELKQLNSVISTDLNAGFKAKDMPLADNMQLEVWLESKIINGETAKTEAISSSMYWLDLIDGWRAEFEISNDGKINFEIDGPLMAIYFNDFIRQLQNKEV